MHPRSAIPLVLLLLSAPLGCARGTLDTDAPEDEGPFLEPAARVLGQIEIAQTMLETEERPAWQRSEPLPLQGDPPAPVVLDEAMACATIVDTYHAHGLHLGCATTTHVCPDMLRFAFGAACLQYHAATITDCHDRILEATTCEDLWTTTCTVEPLWNSAPLGCTASE